MLFKFLYKVNYSIFKAHRVVLTIDDGPTPFFSEKVEFLLENNIPSVFFCSGSNIQLRSKEIVSAIKCGVHIANHAYSHTSFLNLSAEQGVKEIEDTENLISKAYIEAGENRTYKFFRFPYGIDCFEEKEKYEKLQQYLKENGFISIESLFDDQVIYFDTKWNLDSKDWTLKYPNQFDIETIDDIKQSIETQLLDIKVTEVAVLLMHDTAEIEPFFRPIINVLRKKRIDFIYCK